MVAEITPVKPLKLGESCEIETGLRTVRTKLVARRDVSPGLVEYDYDVEGTNTHVGLACGLDRGREDRADEQVRLHTILAETEPFPEAEEPKRETL